MKCGNVNIKANILVFKTWQGMHFPLVILIQRRNNFDSGNQKLKNISEKLKTNAKT
jgi:hypothetical protein